MIDQAITAAGLAAATWEGRGFWWAQKRARFTTCYQTITTVARATNVATITTSAVHGLLADCRVQVAGVTLADFDDDDPVVVAVPTTSTFTYANTGSDVGATADATGVMAAHAYPLRTINTKALEDIHAPLSVRVDDDYALTKADKEEYDDWMTYHASGGRGQPQRYALWGDLMIGLMPIPDAAYMMTIPYVQRHSKIASTTAAEGALIVPAEFHREVYVDGALWLLRHETVDAAALASSPAWVAVMQRMAAADPSRFYDAPTDRRFPTDRRHFIRDGAIFFNPGTIS